VASYPTVDEVIAVHAQLIAKFGGSLGLRDRGALESALARPQSGYYEDIIHGAAARWEGLSQNHPFVDGNKRVAVTVTAAFLKVNGYLLEFNDLEAFSFLIGLYESGTTRFVELESGCAFTPNEATHGIDRYVASIGPLDNNLKLSRSVAKPESWGATPGPTGFPISNLAVLL
jgi:death on curing protein